MGEFSHHINEMDAKIRKMLLPPLLQIDTPPWRLVSSKSLSDLSGISLQSLSNWRLRGYGPPFVPVTPGRGNKVFYRPDILVAWASEGRVAAWEFCRDWLADRDITIEPSSEAAVQWLVLSVDGYFSKTTQTRLSTFINDLSTP